MAGTELRGHELKVYKPQVHLDIRRRSGIAGAGLSLYARLISHFNITNMVFTVKLRIKAPGFYQYK